MIGDAHPPRRGVGAVLGHRYAPAAQLAAAGAILFFALVRVVYPAPMAILFLGAVLGASSALIAMGIVLIYRANRIINFAAGELGALAGLLGVLLISGPKWPYFGALAAGLAAAMATGAIVEFLFVRRFARAPRLILTVATIGIAQILQFGQLALPQAFGRDLAPQDFPTPFDFTFEWDPVVFRGSHLLAIIVVAGAGIGLSAFLRYTRAGIAIRGVAESAERASQLGIPVKWIGTLVWVLAAALAATASLLRAPIVGVPIGRVLGPSLLLRALAAAVIGRMENLPVTFLASVALGMVEQAVFWSTGRPVITDAVLFAVIIGTLLLQRRREASRAEEWAASAWQMVRQVRPVPSQLQKVPEVRYGFSVLRLAALALLVVVPITLPPSRVNLLGIGLVLAILGISLVILTGWAGEVSLGQMALFGVGAAVAAKTATLGWNFFVCVLAAGAVGALASTAIGIPALRIRGPFLAVATFAFALATSSFFLNTEFFGAFIVDSRIDRPIIFGKYDLESEHAFYYLMLIVLLLVLVSARSIRQSRIGRVLVATRDNAWAAQSYGVNVMSARLVAFGFSGFFAALAGGLFAFHQHALGRSAYAPEQSIRILSMVVFGGLGSIPGVVLGAGYFTALDYFTKLPQTRLLLSGVGLLLVLLIFPGGLGQVLYGIRDAFLRVVAARRRLQTADFPKRERALTGPVPSSQRRADLGDVLLSVERLDVSYGQTQVLFGVDLEVHTGEIVAVLGANGAGKTTLLKAIMGSVKPERGSISFGGLDISRLPGQKTAALGIVMVPGGMGVFPSLSVKEHFALAGWLYRKDPEHLDRATEHVLELFPILRTRWEQKAGTLSGGEQQMLTLAQAFIARPRLLMIDELSIGLAPIIVEQLLEIVKAIHGGGTTVILVEQSVSVALKLADRVVFIEKGEARFESTADELVGRPDVVRSMFLEGAASAMSEGSTRRAASLDGRASFQAECAHCGHEHVEILATSGLSLSFGGIRAVNGVDLSVREGQIVGLIGPNGAGKTTIFNLISGFLTPDEGRIWLNGADVTLSMPDRRARAGLGRSFQDARLFPSMTVAEAVAVALERHIEVRDPLSAALASPARRATERKIAARVGELVELLGLEPFVNRFVSELSTGTRRTLDLACALAHEPRVMLLDEPSAGMSQRDAEALAPVLLDIRERTGAGLLVIEHDMPLITKISDEIVALDLGAVIARGSPSEIVRHPLVVAAYLGSQADDFGVGAGDGRNGPRARRGRMASLNARGESLR